MDEQRREWQKQFNSHIGARELLRFAAVFMAWIFLGVALRIILGSVVPLVIFLIAPFGFAFVSHRWKPAYGLLRTILGNKNLPTETEPRSHTKSQMPRLPWYAYLPGIPIWICALILLYVILKYVAK